MKKRLLWVLVVTVWGSLLSQVANAEEKPICAPAGSKTGSQTKSSTESRVGAAKIAAVQGKVEAKRTTEETWHATKRNAIYCPGDQIRVGKDSRASIILSNDTLVRLDQYSAITLTKIETEGPSLLELVKGIAHFISRVPRSLKVDTPFVNAAIEGTEFVVAVKDNDTTVTVFEGIVLTENANGSVRLLQNESSIAKQGQAPEKILLAKPRDTVQWALYFPPVIKADAEGNTRQQASSLLYRGRVSEASVLLADMGNNGEAKALQAIIAIVNNDKENAFNLAKDAVQLAPDSAAPHIAMSYAWQAQLNLSQALASAEQATNKAPDDAIAWSRLAELQLSVGELSAAQTSAQKATELEPNIARAQTILGYAYLTQIDIDQARVTFNRAIELDQNDPLPHLGLGLAMIRKNELAEGRREIEIAASLDPNNAIIRSYLGKAYYEEKRGPLDAEQFAMAKELDPNDPTPYYYDAIRKQTENNPVGALEDLNKSIELNDNRAVYRSSLQLDQDEAARSASLARIYQDLGFEQAAVNEASKSLAHNPSNHSAHRFLAEAYQNRPRYEIARVGETLQAQLLAPLNNKPTAPSLAETNLGVMPNTVPSAFNEYDALFTRNSNHFDFTGIVGNHETSGGELVYTSLYDDSVVSLGHYNYNSEGFRANNDLKQNISNLFFQKDISPEHNIQFEFKTKEQENGDLALKFDPASFSSTLRHDDKINTYRLGYVYKISPNSRFLSSIIYQDQKFDRTNNVEISPTGPFGPVIAEDELHQNINDRNTELQYMYLGEIYSLIVGGSNTVQGGDETSILQLTSGGIVLSGGPSTSRIDDNSTNGYLYNYFNISNSFDLILGISNDHINSQTGVSANQINPKFGFTWNLSPDSVIRLAAFRTLKRKVTSNQSLEPTQVAGFNQFFDDPNASDTKRYALGFDKASGKNFYYGIHFTMRDIDFPVLSGASTITKEIDEDLHQAYFNWLISRSFTMSIAYIYENFDKTTASPILTLPLELKTRKIPIVFSYQNSTGFNTKLTASHYDQKIVLPTGTGSTSDSDKFLLINLALGYKLPDKKGNISLIINNLLDEDFKYYNSDIWAGSARNPEVQHDRSILLQFSITNL